MCPYYGHFLNSTPQRPLIVGSTGNRRAQSLSFQATKSKLRCKSFGRSKQRFSSYFKWSPRPYFLVLNILVQQRFSSYFLTTSLAVSCSNVGVRSRRVLNMWLFEGLYQRWFDIRVFLQYHLGLCDEDFNSFLLDTTRVWVFEGICVFHTIPVYIPLQEPRYPRKHRPSIKMVQYGIDPNNNSDLERFPHLEISTKHRYLTETNSHVCWYHIIDTRLLRPCIQINTGPTLACT